MKLVAAVLSTALIVPLVPAAARASDSSRPQFRVLHSFGNAPRDGWQPWGSPTLVGNRLWGRTTYGGPRNQSAVIWSMPLNAPRKYRIEHSFGKRARYQTGGRGPDLANPHHDWMRLGPDGRTLYGAALFGGRGDRGGVFSYNTVTGRYRVLRSFAGTTEDQIGSARDAAEPHSNAVPIRGIDGRTLLVGMSAFGGKFGNGTLYEMSLTGERFRLLHSFRKRSGMQPHGFVIQDGRLLYGMTRLGGITASKDEFPSHESYHPYKKGNGVVFRYNLDTGKYVQLHRFRYGGPLAGPTLPGGVVDGAVPDHGGLTLRAGRLWGVTTLGGQRGGGVLFSLRTNGSGYRVHRAFGSANGSGAQAQPHGTLMPGPGDWLYGLSSTGGRHGVGGVFSINTRTWHYREDFAFSGGARGAFGIDNPVVTQAPDGRTVLYGMTKFGGRVRSTLSPTPIAPDWDPEEPALANGTIWRLRLR